LCGDVCTANWRSSGGAAALEQLAVDEGGWASCVTTRSSGLVTVRPVRPFFFVFIQTRSPTYTGLSRMWFDGRRFQCFAAGPAAALVQALRR
jgi:hypothetical protein